LLNESKRKYLNRYVVVPRILYEKSLSLPKRHLRHLFPAVIGIGSVKDYSSSFSFGITATAFGPIKIDQ
jgi:hypothetical protein